ncbi:hypothetical protein K490DRAFT_71751 [Saccharata proteae CBS 121410]|uniref:Rhodopsin domain-containing protein n=1 Tax=Saccharata proteae CBS 121410 TaxID=1314787 RepID=A0A9P4I043_9PEZI|nr:hypothetical protein K490DRAFT_71751 [Saccharata proteae CBS 121410]
MYSNGPQILSITGTFTAIALMTVLLRCYVRAAMLRYFGADDYVMALAMILSVCVFVCFVKETHHGIGRHALVMMSNLHDYQVFSKWQYAHSLLIMVAVSTKAVFLILLTCGCALTLIFQCIPVAAAWDLSLKPPIGTANCYSLTTFRDMGLFNSSINIATDILFASLPIPLIWNLQINKRTKSSLICILSLGYFASAAAAVKCIKQYHVFADPDWTVQDSYNVWNDIELNMGIIAASLPALKPVFNWFLQTARAITSGTNNTARGASASATAAAPRPPPLYRPFKNLSASRNGYRKQREESSSIALSHIPSSQAHDAQITGGGSGGRSSGSGSSYGLDKGGKSGVEVMPGLQGEPGERGSRESEDVAAPAAAVLLQRPREGVIYLTREVSVK